MPLVAVQACPSPSSINDIDSEETRVVSEKTKDDGGREKMIVAVFVTRLPRRSDLGSWHRIGERKQRRDDGEL